MFNANIKTSFQDKKFLITLAVIAICLILSIAFPIKGTMEDLTKDVFFLFIIPILYIKLVLKKNIGDFGLSLGDKKTGTLWGIGMLIVSLLITFVLVKLTDFTLNYKIASSVTGSFWIFLLNMLVFSNLLIFLQEYFFRGFVLSAFLREIGAYAILAQAGIYFAIVIAQRGFGKDLWQMAPMIIMSFTGGITAYKSRTMLYSYISGLLYFILLNAYLIHGVKMQ